MHILFEVLDVVGIGVGIVAALALVVIAHESESGGNPFE